MAKALEMIRAYVAWRNDDYKAVLKGNKVTAFAGNIINPDLAAAVTVDFHALSVAYLYRFTAKTCPRISDGLYRTVSAAYVSVAKEYGLLPQELQAVAWLVWKRIHKV